MVTFPLKNFTFLSHNAVFYQSHIAVEAKKPTPLLITTSNMISSPTFHSSSPFINQYKENHSSTLSSMTSSRSEVDTRRPFRSVKEAVAVFGDRLLSGEAYSQRSSSSLKPESPPPKPQYSPPSPSYSTSSSRFNQDRDEELNIILTSMKKLEAELKETRREVTMLKERGSETEIAVASLNAELHKSKAKLAEMEETSVFMEEKKNLKVGSYRWGVEERNEEEEIMEVKYEYLPSLAATLRLGEADGAKVNGRRRVKVMKKKPIVPLIGDLFSRKKDYGEMGDSVYSKSYFSVVS